MQQVKKQLQDAIKKLKSDWGINEVKREDLAAVLEKVVAALDRAAQLPVAGPAVIEGYTIRYNSTPNIIEGRAPVGAKPALGVSYDGSTSLNATGSYYVFFDAETKKSYSQNSEGINASDFMKGKILCDEESFCYRTSMSDDPFKIIRKSGNFSDEIPSVIV